MQSSALTKLTSSVAAAAATTLLTHATSNTQESGDSLTGAVRSLADTLAAAANSSSAADLQQLLTPSDDKRMFMAVGGTYMLAYSTAAAATLHNAPLVMVLSAPAVLQLLAPSKALPVGEGLRVMGWAAAVSLATFASTLAAPAGFGALRAWATGSQSSRHVPCVAAGWFGTRQNVKHNVRACVFARAWPGAWSHICQGLLQCASGV
eukprot:GHRQ01036012.1.p2 GENE.GHRQ01036012.1~~GHRQ01036012.1.p2  ORF type:complete len:207 (+),score=51.66 GHRQ01036012.1:404-1024(+)